VKNIVPAIASTNAIIAGRHQPDNVAASVSISRTDYSRHLLSGVAGAAACANEALKLATQIAPPLQNYVMFAGGTGMYSYTFEYERKESCPVCGANLLRLTMPADATLEQLIERITAESMLYGRRTRMHSAPLRSLTAIDVTLLVRWYGQANQEAVAVGRGQEFVHAGAAVS